MMALQPADALDLKFYDGDSCSFTTIRSYFKLQLSTLWEKGDSFSGKRPLGDSGWEGVLVGVLIQHHCIPGMIDEDESDEDFIEVIDYDRDAYEVFVQKMIAAL
jgi:hypothetical protein